MKKGIDYIGISCVFFCHDGEGNFLLHKRSKNCRDEQLRWDNGGGALEFGEDPKEAVCREVKEEYCTDVLDINFIKAANILRDNEGVDTHWLALIFAVKVDPHKVKIGEPHKMDEIGWYTEDSFPSPLHSQMLKHFDSVKEFLNK